MAVAFSSAAEGTFASRTSLSVAKPAGVKVGDLMLVMVYLELTGVAVKSTGWTQLTVQEQLVAEPHYVLVTFWKFYEGEAGPYEFTWNGTSHGVNWDIVSYSGVNATPVNTHGGGGSAGASSTSEKASSITTTVANCMLVFMGASSSGFNATPPAGMTERADNGGEVADVIQAAAEATGEKVATLTGAAVNEAQLIALAPEVAPKLKKPTAQKSKVGETISLVVESTTGAIASVVASTLPAGLTATVIDAHHVEIAGKLTTVQTITASLEVEGAGGTNKTTWSWEVEAAAEPPVVTNPGHQTSTKGVAISPLTIVATGAEAGGFSEEHMPAGLSMTSEGVFSGTPTTLEEPTVTVKVKGPGGTTTITFSWAIVEAATASAVVGPWRQQEVLQPGRYLVRHIAPKAAGENEPGLLNPLGAGVVVLGQTLYAEELPISRLPDSPDFTDGQYTLRMLDAGDYTLTFPNKDASDGQPWRTRFNVIGHKEFVEVSREGEIEQIGVIIKSAPDRQKIVVSGFDGFWLLKKAFEQEFTGVMAPRDMIERYSALPVLRVGDEFLGEALALKWNEVLEGTASVSVSVGAGGLGQGAYMVAQGAGGAAEIITSFPTTSARWSLRVGLNLARAVNGGNLNVQVQGPSDSVSLGWQAAGVLPAEAGLAWSGFGSFLARAPTAFTTHAQHTLFLQSDGRWVSAFIDGVLLGVVPAPKTGAEKVAIRLSTVATQTAEMVLNGVFFRAIEPFLMRGSEKGDYVLPGTASTYPTGGLHGRYLVNGASTTTEPWWQTILAPDPRRSGFPEYLQDVQAGINVTSIAGLPANFWAARWFGAIYLPLSKGNVPIGANLGPSTVVRVWIGKTQMGSQLIDSWTALEGTRGLGATVNAASLGGKDGWYPIIIEFANGKEGAANDYINFTFQPPVSYTDPGGTAITGGAAVVVPATSLSPLGCVDARIQGSSHFDLVQETAKNFAYQLRSEPRQLESGEFPCALIPKARVGFDTDERVEADDVDRKSGINNYTANEDATDSATSVKAFGSGIADGKGSQIAFEAVSIPDEEDSLFDMQAWVSAGDIAFPQLLAARADAELGLRLGAWQNVEGEPLARDRLADTFPLTGVLSQFRWRPGDGVRLYLPDVNVNDLTPRQIMQVVRSFGAEGRTNTSIGFRSRPKDPLYALRTAARDISRPARAYQRQYVTRSSSYVAAVLAAAELSGFALVPIYPGERIVDARVLVGINSAVQPVAIEINGGGLPGHTSTLGGPWSTTVVINVLPYAIPETAGGSNRFFVRFKNEGAAPTELDFQLVLTLLA